MLDTFFDLSAVFQLLLLSVLSGFMLVVSFGWLAWLNRRFATLPKLLPVGPAFGPVTSGACISTIKPVRLPRLH